VEYIKGDISQIKDSLGRVEDAISKLVTMIVKKESQEITNLSE